MAWQLPDLTIEKIHGDQVKIAIYLRLVYISKERKIRMARIRKIKNPQRIELTLEDAASDGRTVARHEEKVVFVEGGVPGDRAEVFIFGKQKKFLVGRIEKLIEASPDRVDPPCDHFGVCGGCKWQDMAYEAQIKFKENQVLNAIQRIGKIEAGEALPILGSREIFHYRNKVEFSFSRSVWRTKEEMDKGIEYPAEGALGYHTPRFFDKVIPIEECHLPHPLVNEIRNETERFAIEHQYPFYNIREHEGWLRTLAFRSSVANDELMVILVVAEENKDRIDHIFHHLEARFPAITHLIWIVNKKLNSVYLDQEFRIWKGSPYLTENLGGYDFRIRPLSFFQTNPKQAQVLYGAVRQYLEKALPEGQDMHPVVYDLYSGTGSIGIFVSQLVRKIVGIEYVQSAVDDAWENVKLNHLDEKQFSFYAGDMKAILTDELVEKEGHPDVIIADPPRQGMDPKVVKQIIKVRPEHIIYVSCKPATQARDLEMLRDYYELLSIQPVDMFPHTAHVENIAFLKKRPLPLLINRSEEKESDGSGK